MKTRRQIQPKLSKSALVCLLILLLAFTSIAAVSWHHHNASSEATCQVCHFAHVKVISPRTQVTLFEPRLLYRIACIASSSRYVAFSRSYASTRAPPA